jgi:hypothetical protein
LFGEKCLLDPDDLAVLLVMGGKIALTILILRLLLFGLYFGRLYRFRGEDSWLSYESIPLLSNWNELRLLKFLLIYNQGCLRLLLEY